MSTSRAPRVAFRMRFDLLQLALHEAEVVAVDLHDHLPADAGDRLFDAVLDRLAEVEVDAGPIPSARAHRLDDLLLLRPVLPFLLGLHDHEGLGLVGRLVVGAVFRVALLAEHVLDLGELEQREPHLAQQPAPRSSEIALGIVTVMWMSPSFMGGRNSEPSRGTRTMAPTITAAATSATSDGRRIVTRSAAQVALLQPDGETSDASPRTGGA